MRGSIQRGTRVATGPRQPADDGGAVNPRELTIFLPCEDELGPPAVAPTLRSEYEIVIEVRRDRVEWVLRSLAGEKHPVNDDTDFENLLASGVVDSVCVSWVANDGF